MKMRIGLDIGYSAVKVCYGTGPSPARLMMPVGAGPVTKCPTLMETGAPNLGGGHAVVIDKEYWVAGVEPDHLRDFSARLDASYPESNEYLALYYAALASVNTPVIGALVTGLPVEQYKNPVLRKALADRLRGKHYVRPDLTVVVENVIVVPQPAGAYAAQDQEGGRQGDGRSFRRDDTVLCVDPGHCTVDWTVGRNGLRLESSAHTVTAGAAILARAREDLQREYNCTISQQKLDRALRANLDSVVAGLKTVPFRKAIEAAAAAVVGENVKQMQASVRQISQEDGLDVLLIGGGGATLFEKALTQAFPNARTIVTEDPVTANARGFYYLAGQVAAAASVEKPKAVA